MAELRNNTWTLNAWYDQDVAGTAGYTAGGELWGAGYNVYGMLGNNESGNPASQSSPIQVPGGETTWHTVHIDGYVAKATKMDGTLWAWGTNQDGQSGVNNVNSGYSSPVQIPGTEWSRGYKKMASNSQGFSVHAIRTDGTLWAWGRNYYGALGLNQAHDTRYSSPVQFGTDSDWKLVHGNLAIKTDGSLYVWGPNNFGALGQNQGYPTVNSLSSPVQVPGSWVDAWDAGYEDSERRHMGGVKTDGTLWTWGSNYLGILGHNQSPTDLNSASAPIQIPGTDWSSTVIQRGHSYFNLFAKTDGSVMFTGGGGGYPSVGYDMSNRVSSQSQSSPMQIFASGSTYDAEVLSIAGNGAWLLNKQGELYMWGRNPGWMGNQGPTAFPSYGYTSVANANQWWPHDAGTLRKGNVSGGPSTFLMVKPE